MNSKKPHILYVDDEENNLIALKAAFRRYYHIHADCVVLLGGG